MYFVAPGGEQSSRAFLDLGERRLLLQEPRYGKIALVILLLTVIFTLFSNCNNDDNHDDIIGNRHLISVTVTMLYGCAVFDYVR